ncbi:GAP family protein [Brachybacterium sp. NBEC-018]|uniref:GAP family protein n=1 Tax=Brachybacterium sp. NBEC-018 TaxID=2996004 RepID=UPI0021756D22|nr:GAP family protein [Brachybacterium sp. NBEC-018]UVY84887.1 GAP family protein [Brachybacterium sp. NBEC-018]
MWTAIGETLPLAVGLALSPAAIATAVILLLGQVGKLKTTLFGAGWFVALLVLATIAELLVEAADAAAPAATEAGVDVLQLVFGALFLGLAVLAWLKRPREGQEPRKGILDRLDGLSTRGALVMGLAQGFLVIKNIPLAVGAGARLGEADLARGEAAVALLLFVVVSSLGVLVPLGVAAAGGERLQPALARTRGWLGANMTAVTVVVLVVLGAYFLGEGIGLLD